MRSEVPQHKCTYFLVFLIIFFCFWTPFKCHKERFKVPHVALVPLLEEACNLTNSLICKHDTPFLPIFHVLQKVGGLNDVDLRTYIWSWKLSLITWFIFKWMICTSYTSAPRNQSFSDMMRPRYLIYKQACVRYHYAWILNYSEKMRCMNFNNSWIVSALKISLKNKFT